MADSLSGNTQRTAIVTGASSGIGRAAALALARTGYQVILGARRENLLAEVAAETGGRAQRLDVTDTTSIAASSRHAPGQSSYWSTTPAEHWVSIRSTRARMKTGSGCGKPTSSVS